MPKKVEIWFEKNKENFASSDSIGRIYITRILNKNRRPQRIYVMQNFLGTRKKIGYYKVPQHYFVIESEVELEDLTKNILNEMVV